MFAMPHDDVVKNFDLEELSGADEIASDADVRLGRSWLPAGMIMLCAARVYVQLQIDAAVNRFHREGEGWLYLRERMRYYR